MAERAQAGKIAGGGPDAVPGWYSISFEDLIGLQSGNRDLRLAIPTGVALSLAEAIPIHLRQQAGAT